MSEFSSKIIAHRGESFEAPENTMAAINLAWEKGARAVEIDIHLSLDSEIIVIHDYDTLRLTGHFKLVSNSTLNELRKLNTGFHKGEQWKNEKIPLLKEVLKTLPEDGRLIIEIKSDRTILQKLIDVLLNSGLKDSQIELIAFDLNTLTEAKKRIPQYKMLWLLDLDYKKPCWFLWVNRKKIIKKVKNAGINGVDVWAGKILNQRFISMFKNSGLEVYAWTVNDPVKAIKLIDFGIDGVTTDRAFWMVEQINKR
jgi:glycerophosphoryl diester phosphodiesterase